ncbi:DUF2867 domain-containing protein [uncultured Roseobacter sp.]|uniref:DUF2867 domain-containing protein n=1 Tax=uncultured Roseobacter sp. TaxID=114847 RepID=UPI00260631F2|nr:DUF2867 domain-containing protein [uncultured Roseobacter sp.]
MAPQVNKTNLPTESPLHRRVAPGDFLDCYKVVSNLTAPEAAEIIVNFPSWAKALVLLRNIVVAPFGLLNDGPGAVQKFGPFPVESMSESSVVAGFDDKHLDFRVNILSVKGDVYLATWVHPHNIGGRLYLKAIMPFHILIARNALMRVATVDNRDQYDPLPE